MGGYDPRKWVQLKQRVIREIADGTLKPGDAVPVTTAGVSYQTARKALRELVGEGWLLPATAGYPARVPGADSSLLWRKFRAQVIREIEAGVLEPGDEVTVKHEAHDAGIHRMTASKALAALAAEGWLFPEVRGVRSYTVPPRPVCGQGGRGNCHWPRCRLPDGSCDEARNCVN